MTLWLLAALLVAGFSWFIALYVVSTMGRGDPIYRVWAVYGCWFTVSAVACLRFDWLDAGALGWFVAGSFALSAYVGGLIERRW